MSVRKNHVAMLLAGAAAFSAVSAAHAEFSGRMFAVTVELLDPSTNESLGSETWDYWFEQGGVGTENVTLTEYNWAFDSNVGAPVGEEGLHDSQVIMEHDGGAVSLDAARVRLQDTTINPLTAGGGGGALIAEADFSVTNNTFANAVITATSNNETAAASIADANANASSSVQVNDFGGFGASLTPFGGSGYQAFFNGAAAGTGSVFAAHHGAGLVAGPFGSANDTVDTPAPGVFGPVGASVSSISGQFTFNLGNFNTASGTSTFTVIIPAPASIAALGLGGLVATRRRR